MTLFTKLNHEDIQVRVNYGKADVAGTGPFMWIKANRAEIDELIPSNTLLEYLKPPMKFVWRRMLFYWIFGMIALTLSATLVFILVINKYEDESQIKRLTFSFLGMILSLMLVELAGILYCLKRFQAQLLEYVERLNRETLSKQGLEFYYPKGYCWGNNINVLGIRRMIEGRESGLLHSTD